MPLPTQMADHWWRRPGRVPGRMLYHWHMLFHDQPEVQRLARLGQRKLDGLPELDMVPIDWLHLTMLIAGFADEVTDDQVTAMTAEARASLPTLAPVPVTLGRVVYHPEAVVLAVEPLDALSGVLQAVRASTLAAGIDGHTDTEPWLPHISIAYSHGCGPAAPVIAALGRRLPETRITVSSVSLVAQTQAGRSWQWQPQAEIALGPG
jgi:2'-5' RNA ligase